MIRQLTLALPAIAALSVSTVDAQAVDSTTWLPTVVVTATKDSRAPITQSVTVITGAELRATGVARIADALRAVPGAAVVSNGSFGSVTSLFIRGGESRYTKVLIDGVTVNNVGGYFDLSHLTTDDVERIEIVRGPASVVHGADAVSGVVQIFTRSVLDRARIEGGVRAGTYATLDTDLALSGSRGGASGSIGGARHTTDGILPFNNRYENGTLSGSARFALPRVGTVRLASRYTAAEFHYPTDFAGNVVDSNSYRDQHRLVLSLDAARSLRGADVRLMAGTNDVSDVTDDVGQPLFCATPPCADAHTRFLSRNYRRRGELRLTLPVHSRTTLTTGVEYMRERERSVDQSGPVGGALAQDGSFSGRRTTRSGYAELGWRGSVADITASGRLDDPSDFGSFRSWRAGAALKLPLRLRLRGTAGTAFNAPAFSQLLPTAFTSGSPDLQPERARSYEFALDVSTTAGTFTLLRFDQRFEQLIQFVSGGPPTFTGSYANLAEATSRGLEAEFRSVSFAELSLTAQATFAQPQVVRVDPSLAGTLKAGDALLRRPRESGALAVSRRAASGSFSVAARYVGQRWDLDFRAFPSPRVRLPSYSVTDISFERPVLRLRGQGTLTLTARVENAFDKAYQEVLYYDAPGRTVLVGGRVALR